MGGSLCILQLLWDSKLLLERQSRLFEELSFNVFAIGTMANWGVFQGIGATGTAKTTAYLRG